MWKVQPSPNIPHWMIPEIQRHHPNISGKYLCQLLLCRGISTREQLTRFLEIDSYQPASPAEFGAEMQEAIARLTLAYQKCISHNNPEKIVIWGDFDADGITATAVLWEGLRQFFGSSVSYTIPNRLTDSHGLNQRTIETLAAQGCSLIITCDTGSTNLAELQLAQDLGIDVIITDHHTLPPTRPPVLAIINPRNLPTDHPLYHLSGVAIAYKLIEALYMALPGVSQQPLENLLDLVAIGLIADLVELSGDCRYLAKRGIQQLQKQLDQPTRPGVAELLKLCQKNGDRPTDISFGIGPRINAVSRIYGDVSCVVELLTTPDPQRAKQLAINTEIANLRRRELQKNLAYEVREKLQRIDLSTTYAIVLSDPQWSVGVLGLVAGQIAQEYSRPTILLTTEGGTETGLARGSARSINQIDLYDLVYNQRHLLHNFGGHPFAAGLSLPIENIPIFTQAIDRELRQRMGGILLSQSPIIVDLVCTVAELGSHLFKELKLLEPCGMGNPVPKLLIKNCWFDNVWNENPYDLRGKKVQYIRTTYDLFDDSTELGFPGVWWGHYKEELPPGRYDAIVELDFNAHKRCYEVRLLAVRPALSETEINPPLIAVDIADFRNHPPGESTVLDDDNQPISWESNYLVVSDCPGSWEELTGWFAEAVKAGKKLAIAYSPPPRISPQEVWQKLTQIADNLSHNHQGISPQDLLEKLAIGDIALTRGLHCLKSLGYQIELAEDTPSNKLLYISSQTTGKIADISESDQDFGSLLDIFFATIEEEQFTRQYFCEVPLETIDGMCRIS
ncbi:single-stranded-DNA-specific exonuclease RecJ [Arthrospira platensis]|uniref:single-stranded-DNA-specific exonuclease RecJ n=1 Tax=Limnospira TaxID=2596745 RepID=UPI0001C38E3E|nr:single-stranded-DNA-specific exonuclease RecJ [Arthrospira platensis]AMW29061.1 single-stranded-DNA-specific exonuclease RecJ [Arthrospira platensis YZ]KDR55034.1 single-stranded DNA exonuclease [Arthrospira platensis str. Paraca]MBD2667816.1 single-stranded-DNA-specific exonuclease RecJ [Arthrospira platensis FACHB-439]MBD2708627.1 single-stranded-DNA-specific exonuclease RecJ [Arthrospira platensis FACHB-835]MDT9309456.1 single-stranded-DNA-specific exonuclease RecJ [Limnospira sp. Paraca